MRILYDIKDFLLALHFVDFVFFFAVLALMILIVTLIYFVRINYDVLKQEEKEDKMGETREMKIVNEITKDIGKNDDKLNIDFTEYEKEQEDKAIISYDELLSKNNNYEINYENEEIHDDLLVKKFNLDNLVNKDVKKENIEPIGRVISFAKEEAFLQALKQLQKELY